MYEQHMDPAFPGMKVDSGDDRVESVPVGAPLGFGLVCGANSQGLAVPGTSYVTLGITLQTHTIPSGVDKYQVTDCASVMTRGLVWAQVVPEASVSIGRPVMAAADGRVSVDDGVALANAIFRSDKVTVENGMEIAQVELHRPFA